jgi:hypothetical protein
VLRSSISVAALFITACLGVASGNLAHPARLPESAKTPSQLDYLVLASIADSQHPLSMAAYQSSP